mgnify:CR=1 FL=1
MGGFTPLCVRTTCFKHEMGMLWGISVVGADSYILEALTQTCALVLAVLSDSCMVLQGGLQQRAVAHSLGTVMTCLRLCVCA